MAAQAALHSIRFPATNQFKTASRANIFPDSVSFMQGWGGTNVFKVSRETCFAPRTSAAKVAGVAFARSSASSDRVVNIRFEDDATITSEPFGEKQLKVNVNLNSVATRGAFNFVLENLGKSAPPVQGFRKAKGGKSVIPRDVLYQMLGPSRVDSFVVEEIVSSSVLEYVEKEGFKVKKDFKTVQSNKELAALFKAGKEFVFDAILSLEDAEPETASVEES